MLLAPFLNQSKQLFSVTAQSQIWTNPGTYRLTVPYGVRSICVFLVGGGGGGSGSVSYEEGYTRNSSRYHLSYINKRSGAGGGGGAVVWANNVSVRPGENLTFQVGRAGTASTVRRSNSINHATESLFRIKGKIILQANGGKSAIYARGGSGGDFTGSVAHEGRRGGNGGNRRSSSTHVGGGGGGAGGEDGQTASSPKPYFGNGGNGFGAGIDTSMPDAGTGGSVGENRRRQYFGRAGKASLLGGGGGGASRDVYDYNHNDLYGGPGRHGGGGGGAGAVYEGLAREQSGGSGGHGVVYIIWGAGRSFPYRYR